MLLLLPKHYFIQINISIQTFIWGNQHEYASVEAQQNKLLVVNIRLMMHQKAISQSGNLQYTLSRH